jgi:acyl-coenzyme A thioesterase PaaI-like protein
MDPAEPLEPLSVRDNHMCFACGPANPTGLKMRFFAGPDSVVSWLTVPGHLRGWSNLVHGGVISTILDEIMSWTAIRLLKTVILTKTMTVEFRKPVYVGRPLKATGRILNVENQREALLEGTLACGEEISARATGTFALLKPKVALKLGIVDAQTIRDFLPDFDHGER